MEVTKMAERKQGYELMGDVRLPFNPDEDDTRDRAYELMGDALAPGEKTGGCYEQVLIGPQQKNGSCLVQIGRLCLRVVDWWEEAPLTVVALESARLPTGIADARGPEVASNPDYGI
jgi:hypothetical protein